MSLKVAKLNIFFPIRLKELSYGIQLAPNLPPKNDQQKMIKTCVVGTRGVPSFGKSSF